MSWSVLAFSLALTLLALGGLLFWRSRQWQQQTGLPVGRVIYTDTGAWHPNIESLHSSAYRLVGRPDYLVQQVDGEIIPVEVKSGRAPAAPWDGHIFQLASYCLLVEEVFGTRPSYGIIQYRDKAFAIEYTAELEDELLELLDEMRDATNAYTVDRDHDDYRRCAACGFNHLCDQSLVG